MQPLELAAQLRAQPRVEVGEGLVEEEDARLAHQRPAERDPLPLPSGQLARLAREERCDAEERRSLGDAPLDLGPRQAPHLQREGEVPAHVLVRVESVALEDHRHVALGGREAVHLRAVDAHRSAGRLVETGDEIQGRRFAAARGTHQRQELAVGDLQRQLAQRVRGSRV